MEGCFAYKRAEALGPSHPASAKFQEPPSCLGLDRKRPRAPIYFQRFPKRGEIHKRSSRRAGRIHTILIFGYAPDDFPLADYTSGIKPAQRPRSAGAGALIDKAVMQAVGPGLPELDLQRRHAKARPVRRARHVAVCEFFFKP